MSPAAPPGGPSPDEAGWATWLDAQEGYLAALAALAEGRARVAPTPPALPTPAGPVPPALRRRLVVLAARFEQAPAQLLTALVAARPRRAYARRGAPPTPAHPGRDLRL